MSGEGKIEMSGIVEEILPGTKFKVRLDNGHVLRAYLGGKLRMNLISIIVGDRVTVELSPYDLSVGRIVWRNK